MGPKDLNLILTGDETDETYIQVPIKKADFGDFITNLLGQRETINSRTDGQFTITHEWLVHLHHLLEQRIKLQANSSLVDFSAKIDYENAPSRRITTANGFTHFNETLAASTKSISITWTYLVFFPGKPAPEKQEISLKAMASHSTNIEIEGAIVPKLISSDGHILLSVSHTERTWGDDITNILSREIESVFTPPSLISKCKDYALPLFAITLFLFGVFLPDYVEQLIKQKEAASLLGNLYPQNGALTSLSTDEKLNLIINLLNPHNQLTTVSTIYKAASVITGSLLALGGLFWFDTTNKSYILITKKDQKDKQASESKAKSELRTKIFSYAAAVAAGMIANYLYYIFNLPTN